MKIALLGCGNLARALIPGLKNHLGGEFYCYTPNGVSAKSLASLINGVAIEELEKMPAVDYLILAFKPQQLEEAYRSVANAGVSYRGVVSLMAAVKSEKLKKLFGQPVLRVMANTPNLVGKGVNLLSKSSDFNSKDFSRWLEAFEKISKAKVYEEELLDYLTPHTACSPAIIFELARILSEHAGQRIDQAESLELIAMALEGAAYQIRISKENPAILRDRVTSKGGMTHEILDQLKIGQFADHLTQGLDRAIQRGKELAK